MIRDEKTGQLLCGWNTPHENDGFCRKPAVTICNTLPCCEKHAAIATGQHCVCFFCSVSTPAIPIPLSELTEQAQRIVANCPDRDTLPVATTNHRVGCCPRHRRRYHVVSGDHHDD